MSVTFLREVDIKRLSPPLGAIKKLDVVETDRDGMLDFTEVFSWIISLMRVGKQHADFRLSLPTHLPNAYNAIFGSAIDSQRI